MQPKVEFRGRLSRSDRRPANPGRYALLFQLFPAEQSRRVLWSETHDKVEVRAGGFYDIVLGTQAPLEPRVFAESPRWLAVQILRQGRPVGEHAPRVPLLGDTLRLDARLDTAVGRIRYLEDALAGRAGLGEDDERAQRLRALPGRIQRLFDRLHQVTDRVEGLEDEAPVEALREALGRLDARIAGAEQKLARAEDELEELVGPDGDVVDLLDRVEVLEVGGGGGGAAGRPRAAESELAMLKAAVDQLRRRQGKLEDAIGQMIGRMGVAGVVTATFPSRQPPLEGAVVSVIGGQAVTARAGRGAVVGVSLGSQGARVTVAVGGVVDCRVIGAVSAGELLVPSEVAGLARAGGDGPAIGRALADHLDGRGKVKVRLL